jgi:hypothetical protein
LPYTYLEVLFNCFSKAAWELQALEKPFVARKYKKILEHFARGKIKLVD